MDLPLLHDFLYRIMSHNTNYKKNFNNKNNLHFSSISVPENNNINIYNSILVDTKSSKSILHSSTIVTTKTTTTTNVN